MPTTTRPCFRWSWCRLLTWSAPVTHQDQGLGRGCRRADSLPAPGHTWPQKTVGATPRPWRVITDLRAPVWVQPLAGSRRQCGERTHRKKGRRAAWAAACLGRPFPAVQRGALGGCGRGGSTKKPFEFPIRNSYTSSALPCYSSYESFLVHNVWLTLMLRYP